MTRDDLVTELAQAAIAEGLVVYVERQGDVYSWSSTAEAWTSGAAERNQLPDAWIYYSGAWPPPGPARAPFLDDLLAEMESMVSEEDRCRWPLDDPYSHLH